MQRLKRADAYAAGDVTQESVWISGLVNTETLGKNPYSSLPTPQCMNQPSNNKTYKKQHIKLVSFLLRLAHQSINFHLFSR